MSLFSKILIPTDGSARAKTAITKGLELAKLTNAQVTAMSIADAGQLAYSAAGPNMVDIYRYLEQDAEMAVQQVRKEGEAMGLDVRTIVKTGNAAKEIIAASKDFDLIVMNHLGHTGLVEHLIGGVAEKVVRLAVCPVLVVRAPG